MSKKSSKGRNPKSLGSVWKQGSVWRWQFRKKNSTKLLASGKSTDELSARRALATAIVDAERGQINAPTKVTLREQAASWLKRQTTQRSSTLKMYEESIALVCRILGDLPLTSIKSPTIKNALIELSQKKTVRGKLFAPSSIHRAKGLLSSVFEEAVEDELLYRNPVPRRFSIGVEDLEDRSGKSLTQLEARSLRTLGWILFNAGVCRLWIAIFVALNLGLRRGELAGLRWCDIDLEKSRLFIRQNLTEVRGRAVIHPPKTKRSRRTIPFKASVHQALSLQLEKMKLEASIRDETVQPDSPVFATIYGEYTYPSNVNRALRDILEWVNPTPKPRPVRRAKGVKPRKLKPKISELERRLKGLPIDHREPLRQLIENGLSIPNISPHDLRHTAGTLMLRLGLKIAQVSRILGHAKTSTTADIYQHITDEEIEIEMVDILGDD
jgi:integrase